jgi:hypothetical protein
LQRISAEVDFTLSAAALARSPIEPLPEPYAPFDRDLTLLDTRTGVLLRSAGEWGHPAALELARGVFARCVAAAADLAGVLRLQASTRLAVLSLCIGAPGVEGERACVTFGHGFYDSVSPVCSIVGIVSRETR